MNGDCMFSPINMLTLWAIVPRLVWIVVGSRLYNSTSRRLHGSIGVLCVVCCVLCVVCCTCAALFIRSSACPSSREDTFCEIAAGWKGPRSRCAIAAPLIYILVCSTMVEVTKDVRRIVRTVTVIDAHRQLRTERQSTASAHSAVCMICVVITSHIAIWVHTVVRSHTFFVRVRLREFNSLSFVQ